MILEKTRTMAGTHFYCIDGTNLVRGGYGYGGPNFREQENADCERLIKALSQLCQNLGTRIEVEVFFDGAWRQSAPNSSNLRVRFTREIQADDLILDRVRSRRYSSLGSVTVATSDSELGRMVCDEGGRWLRVSPGATFESVIGAIERRFLK